MKPICDLLRTVLDGHGSYILVKIIDLKIEVRSDIKSSISQRFANSLLSIQMLFEGRPCFHEKLGLLHVKKIFCDEEPREYGCSIRGYIKRLAKEKLSLEFKEVINRNGEETVFYMSYEHASRILVRLEEPSSSGLVQDILYAIRGSPESITISKEVFQRAHVIGQLNNEFIVAGHENRIFVIDQHALDERILLEDLLEGGNLSVYEDSDELDALKSTACKNAVKFGMRLSVSKLKKMLCAIVRMKFPSACAHGRTSICILKEKASYTGPVSSLE